MLVLSRKVGQSIVVPNHHIVLTVLEVCGNRVRLGITAPPSVPVDREEIWVRRCRDKIGAPLPSGAADP